MSMTAPQIRIDPLRAFIAGGFEAGTPRPVPLVATRFDVLIEGGLAVVTTSRTFRNAESRCRRRSPFRCRSTPPCSP